jgi:hypothetical protein
LGRLDSAAAGLADLAAAAHAGELDRASAVAAVAEARALAAVLEAAELAAIDAARAAGATWNELAAAIGVRGRQGALKRRTDLARRAPAAGTAPGGAEGAAPAGSPQPATPPAPAAAGVLDADAGGGQESSRWATDEEYSRTLRHRPVAGLGPEWTCTEDDRGTVILWREKTARAGSARRDFRKGGWEAMSPRLYRVLNASQPSRVKALRAAAADFEGRRRKATPAGPDVPLPGAGGWVLRQTLAERDERHWRVVAPDGTVAGTVHPSCAGARSWAATHGDPDSGSYYGAPVSPAGKDEAALAAGDGLDWKTRDAAAYGLAHWHDPDSAPPAALAVTRAAEARKEKQERKTAP